MVLYDIISSSLICTNACCCFFLYSHNSLVFNFLSICANLPISLVFVQHPVVLVSARLHWENRVKNTNIPIVLFHWPLLTKAPFLVEPYLTASIVSASRFIGFTFYGRPFGCFAFKILPRSTSFQNLGLIKRYFAHHMKIRRRQNQTYFRWIKGLVLL